MGPANPKSNTDPDSMARLLRKRLRSTRLELPVSGSSMKGTIDSDWVVTITAAARPRRGEVWAFVADDGRLIVHRIRHLDPAGVTLRGVGNRRDDQPTSRARLIGRVVAGRGPGRNRRFGKVDRIRADFVFRGRSVARIIFPRRR